MLRLLLLYRHGGVWIDASSILTEDLEWVVTKKLRESSVGSSDGGRPPADVFAFHFNERYHNPDFSDLTPSRAPVLESWFIAARGPKMRFITVWLLRFLEMLLRPNVLAYVADFERQGLSTGSFDAHLRVYLRIHLAAFYVLQSAFRKLCGGGAGGVVVQGLQEGGDPAVSGTTSVGNKQLVFRRNRHLAAACTDETAALTYYSVRTESALAGPFWITYFFGFDWSTDAVENNRAFFEKIATKTWPLQGVFPRYFVKLISMWVQQFPSRSGPLNAVVKGDSLIGRLFSTKELES